ncbi:mitochondrial ATP synthase g subunit-domain-containing protein [Phellopilus nigrolimitatus]|nr:mitochondrial ATP synthase g subunit-domain-containing protein [Phellopilus nigrolimitatus]
MSRAFLSSLRASRPSSSSAFARSMKAPRRFNSSNSTQQKAQETAQKAQEKAQEAFVTAQKGFAKAVEMAKKASGGVGERVGNMLGSYREPLLYNLSVGRELLKQVYLAERLQPPASLSTVTSAYQSIWARASSPAYWREILHTGEYKRVGVYALEAYGIFKIGEIIGRRHLVGYKLE